MTIVDVHTHLMWFPDHIEESTAREALSAKLVKFERSSGLAHAAHLDLHCWDSTPEEHWAAAQEADRVVVFGLHAKPSRIFVPNEVVADYVRRDPERLEGWASVNPAEPGAVEELEHCVQDLGLRGLKVGPTYQHWDPRDPRKWAVFEYCARHDLPVIIHQGTTFPSTARLGYAQPLQLEPMLMHFPDLRVIIAHLGHPWEQDVVALMRKVPNLYADISALHYRPYRYWHAMITAFGYGVTRKLLLASDFPSATIGQTLAGLRRVNDIVAGTPLPMLPGDEQERIVHENWRRFFGVA
ncbi:amidohydrolase family protein [Dactylosporangium sp. CA-233914]|uniref:amidohydrolase family protein n=1 Tax=Dactylosporangium sp. CA-233914 TaxID=3239934 RepID=UPI003D93D728